jgi:hypothetical protein
MDTYLEVLRITTKIIIKSSRSLVQNNILNAKLELIDGDAQRGATHTHTRARAYIRVHMYDRDIFGPSFSHLVRKPNGNLT